MRLPSIPRPISWVYKAWWLLLALPSVSRAAAPVPSGFNPIGSPNFFENLFNPENSTTGNLTLTDIMVTAITLVLTVGGVIAVVMFIMNAITLASSAGDAAKIEQAKKGIIWTLAGVVLVVLALIIIAATKNAAIGNR